MSLLQNADAGHKVKFLKPTKVNRTADVKVDGVLREIKIPNGNNGSVGHLNANTQFYKAQRNGLQSDKLIISEHLIHDLLEEGRDYSKEVVKFWKEWSMFTEVWFVDYEGNIHELKK